MSLSPSFRLSLAHMSSYKFPMKLVASDGQTFCLAAPDIQTMNVWYNHIQSQLSLDNLPDKKGERHTYTYIQCVHEIDRLGDDIKVENTCLAVTNPKLMGGGFIQCLRC